MNSSSKFFIFIELHVRFIEILAGKNRFGIIYVAFEVRLVLHYAWFWLALLTNSFSSSLHSAIKRYADFWWHFQQQNAFLNEKPTFNANVGARAKGNVEHAHLWLRSFSKSKTSSLAYSQRPTVEDWISCTFSEFFLSVSLSRFFTLHPFKSPHAKLQLWFVVAVIERIITSEKIFLLYGFLLCTVHSSLQVGDMLVASKFRHNKTRWREGQTFQRDVRGMFKKFTVSMSFLTAIDSHFCSRCSDRCGWRVNALA